MGKVSKKRTAVLVSRRHLVLDRMLVLGLSAQNLRSRFRQTLSWKGTVDRGTVDYIDCSVSLAASFSTGCLYAS